MEKLDYEPSPQFHGSQDCWAGLRALTSSGGDLLSIGATSHLSPTTPTFATTATSSERQHHHCTWAGRKYSAVHKNTHTYTRLVFPLPSRAVVATYPLTACGTVDPGHPLRHLWTYLVFGPARPKLP